MARGENSHGLADVGDELSHALRDREASTQCMGTIYVLRLKSMEGE